MMMGWRSQPEMTVFRPLDARSATSPLSSATAPAQGAVKYDFIDALRGYAVMLVITSHIGRVFPQLPYPVTRQTEFGWYGVQLFFLMSCVTLLLSWRGDEQKGRANAADFLLRRFFRIAPLYYLATGYYFVTQPPPGGFDPWQLLASLSFVNAWHPATTPTLPWRWYVVPGGWSIGVEFTFYAIFPIVVARIRSFRMASAAFAAALVIGIAGNALGHAIFAGAYNEEYVLNFLFYWFPGQLPVFALGAVLYFALQHTWRPGDATAAILRRHANTILLVCLALCVLVAALPMPKILALNLPSYMAASFIFAVMALTLGNAPGSIFINRPIRALGTVSFSAYIIHFSVIHWLATWLPGWFGVNETKWSAILHFVALWLAVLLVTFGISSALYAVIEKPMIALGRRVISARRNDRTQALLS
jgi:peptidoglycan/LPS O-acetylase OafA/YrhL